MHKPGWYRGGSPFGMSATKRMSPPPTVKSSRNDISQNYVQCMFGFEAVLFLSVVCSVDSLIYCFVCCCASYFVFLFSLAMRPVTQNRRVAYLFPFSISLRAFLSISCSTSFTILPCPFHSPSTSLNISSFHYLVTLKSLMFESV